MQTVPNISKENLGRVCFFSIYSTTFQFSILESCANPNIFFGLLIHDLRFSRCYKNRPVDSREYNPSAKKNPANSPNFRKTLLSAKSSVQNSSKLFFHKFLKEPWNFCSHFAILKEKGTNLYFPQTEMILSSIY